MGFDRGRKGDRGGRGRDKRDSFGDDSFGAERTFGGERPYGGGGGFGDRGPGRGAGGGGGFGGGGGGGGLWGGGRWRIPRRHAPSGCWRRQRRRQIFQSPEGLRLHRPR